jgi:hypothetical protein
MSLHDPQILHVLDLLHEAEAVLESGLTPLPPSQITVSPGQSIQAAIDNAAADATILIEPGVYAGHLAIGARPVTLRPSVPVPTGTRDPAWNPVTITDTSDTTITLSGSDRARLLGLTVRNTNPQATLITDLGIGTQLDRLLVLGDVVNGQHRGILAHGQDGVYVNLFVDDCGLPGRDGQAICGWDGTRDLLITDSYLGGAAQSLMFGGADSTSPERMPTRITVERCHLGKNPDWYGKFDVKTSLELKCCVGFVMTDCVLQWSGTSGGQSGYLIVLTPRNQDGAAPWSCIDGVLIERCRCITGGAGISLLGRDDTNPSGPLVNVVIRDVSVEDINPASYGGSGWVVFLNHAPQHVTIERLTAQGPSVQSIVYVVDPAVGLTLRDFNVTGAPSEYPYKINDGGSGLAALQAYMPDAVIAITDQDQGAQHLPPAPGREPYRA